MSTVELIPEIPPVVQIDDDVILVVPHGEDVQVEVSGQDNPDVSVNEELVEITAGHDEGTLIVLAGVPGPQGERGLTGEAGESNLNVVLSPAFEQNFATPSEEWVVQHNLGFTPAITTYDTAGRQVRGLVVHNNAEQAVVSFYFPVAGRVTCS